MSLCLTDTVVEFEDFHTLVTFLLALNTVLVECYLTVTDVLLRAQQDIHQLCLETSRTSEHEPRWSSSRQYVRVSVSVGHGAKSTCWS